MRFVLLGIVFLIFLRETFEQELIKEASQSNFNTIDGGLNANPIDKNGTVSSGILISSYIKGVQETISKGAGVVGESMKSFSQVMRKKSEQAREMLEAQVLPDLKKGIEAFGNKLESVYNSLGEFDGEAGSSNSTDDDRNKTVDQERENAPGVSTYAKKWLSNLHPNFSSMFNLFGFISNIFDILKKVSELLQGIVSKINTFVGGLVDTMYLVVYGWLLAHLIVYLLKISNSLTVILSPLFFVLRRSLSKRTQANKTEANKPEVKKTEANNTEANKPEAEQTEANKTMVASSPVDEPVVKFTKGEFDIRSVSLSVQKVTDDISSSHFLKFSLYYEISHFPTLKGDIFLKFNTFCGDTLKQSNIFKLTVEEFAHKSTWCGCSFETPFSLSGEEVTVKLSIDYNNSSNSGQYISIYYTSFDIRLGYNQKKN